MQEDKHQMEYQLLLKQEIFETKIFVQLSDGLADLRSSVIQTGNLRSFKFCMLLKRLKQNPVNVVKMFFKRVFFNTPLNLSPLKEIEESIQKIHELSAVNEKNFPALKNANALTDVSYSTESLEVLRERNRAHVAFFEHYSSSLYNLSCRVMDIGRTKTLKIGLFLRLFFHYPFSTPITMFLRKIKGHPFIPAPLKQIEEKIYQIHLLLEPCRQNNQRTELTLIQRLKEGTYKGIWIIGSLDMGWHETFKQRHHHLAENLSKQGYLIFCAMNPAHPDDLTDYIRQEQENLYLVNFNDRRKRQTVLAILLIHSVRPIYYSLMPTEPGTTIDDLYFLQSVGITVYYDYFDELSKDIYPGITRQHLDRHEYLLKNPDVLICTTSENLYKKAIKYRSEKIMLSPNGVCLEDWNTAPDAPIPAEMEPVLKQNKKIIGFYGSFAAWLDYDMIKALAAQRPDYNIVMIGYDYEWGKGDFARSAIKDFPNVFIISAQKYENLKFFSRFFDVGIIPFRIYELTESVSPVKMFEYMAQGIPVVTTALPECKRYKSCIIATDSNDFVTKIDFALTQKNNVEYQAVLKKEAAENTWSAIAEKMTDFITQNTFAPPCSDELLLTIAIPTYNMQDYLPGLLERLAHPSILKNTEIIIINDGSQDESLKIAREYERQYPNAIKVIDKENGGHGSCINIGIKNAKGKYFKLVDADDFLDPGALKAHLNLLTNIECDMIICDYCQYFNDNSVSPVSYKDRLEVKIYDPTELTRALQIDKTMYSYAHMHSITYRTELLKKNNITLSVNSFYVDQEYISYPFTHVKSIFYQPIELYYYRLGRPGQSVAPAVIKKNIHMNYNILKKLICNLETITADKQTTRDYLLNIIYHHSWFYLTNTDDPQKFKEIMDWWKQNESDKTYYNLLRGEFSTEPSARERRKSQKKWLKSNILHWYEW